MNCTEGAVCLGGVCDAVLHACVCDLGFNGTLCEIVRVDAVPEAWLAARVSVSVLHGILFVVAFVFASVYWALRRSVFPRINREQAALFLMGLGSLLRVVAVAVDPFRFNWVREGLPVPQGYDAGLNVINNLAFVLPGVSYAVLLALWVNVRTARGGSKGWSVVGRGVFIGCAIFCLILAFAMAFVETYVTPRGHLIFLGVLAIFLFCVGLYIVVSAIQTLREISSFKNRRTRMRMKKLATQLVLVGAVFLGVIFSLVFVSVLPWDRFSVLALVWVRLWFGVMIQAFAAVGILYIFRYAKWKEHLASTGSSAETGTTMKSGTESDSRQPTSFEKDLEEYVVDM